MKAILGVVVALMCSSTAMAGILDDTIFDRRSPVEKCQSQVADSYGGYSDLLAACSSVQTDYGYKCIKKVSLVGGKASVAKVKTCGFVNTAEGLKAMNSVLSTFGTAEDLMVAASFADTKAESDCVSGLVSKADQVSVKSIVSCTSDGFLSFLKRMAVVNF